MRNKLSVTTIKSLQIKSGPYEVVDEEIRGFLLRVQPSGVMTFYLSYRCSNGTKKRYKIGRYGSLTPVQARDIAIKLSAMHLSGVDIQEQKKEAKLADVREKASTLEVFLSDQYEPWIKLGHKRGLETVTRIRYNFKEYLHFSISKLNHKVIENWRSEQLKLGKKARTINRDVAALRGCMSKALDWKVLESHPLQSLKQLKTDSCPNVRYLSIDEEARLRQYLAIREQQIKQARASANAWRESRGYKLFPDLEQHIFVSYLTPMVLLSINTGLRQGELFSLQWEDLDLHRGILTVNGSTAKSGKTRHVPLNSEALGVAKVWRNHSTKQSGLVFPSENGCKLNNVRKSWGSLLKKADITKFRWHDMRHHFASKLAMAGVDLNTIRDLLGHADLSMTLRYAHLAPEFKASAVEKLVNNSY